MEKQRKRIRTTWSMAVVMLLICAACFLMFAEFSFYSSLGVLILEGSVIIYFGEALVKQDNKRKLPYPAFFFSLLTLSILAIACYLIEQSAYTLQVNYGEWLWHGNRQRQESIAFEVATLLIAYYIVGMVAYSEWIWKQAKKEITSWVPNLWCILLAICLMMYSRQDYTHTVRIGALFVGTSLMIGYLIYKQFISRAQWVRHKVNVRAYLSCFLIGLLGIWMIGICIPTYQELPGARWFRSVALSFGAKTNLGQKIPYETRLNNDIGLSSVVLFEVESSEPLYLRDVAYSEYNEGKWRLPEKEESYEEYIEFKPQYLEAEYGQTTALLNEIAFQNRKNSAVLRSYARVANYEAGIIRQKSYRVLQNPIDKINYFTVNGLKTIQDDAANKIYYYQNLATNYFHSETLVEPSEYQVTYYDHVPKIGSREYMFLRSMSRTTWEKIYKQVSSNRQIYGLYNEGIPKLLYTYTPLIQYKNASEKFSQIPEILQEPLEELAKQITMSSPSDWEKAELICNYLKQNYKYHLKRKKIEGDRVLNFLFEEKEGICQDFATSMTLMCRSIGIPAKYVTGYLVSEKNGETGRYIVREKDAHAFVEVYIAGYGWMSFDPTPEGQLEEVMEDSRAVFDIRDYMMLILIGIGVGGIILLSKGGLTYFNEKWWLLILKFSKPPKQIELLMRRELMWLEQVGFGKENYETLSQYAARLKKNQLDITDCVVLYEKQRYGEIQSRQEELQLAYENYTHLKIALKKLKNIKPTT